MISFQRWDHSNKWVNMFFFDVHIIMDRVYFQGYKSTPLCKVTKFKIWTGSEEDKINAR